MRKISGPFQSIQKKKFTGNDGSAEGLTKMSTLRREMRKANEFPNAEAL